MSEAKIQHYTLGTPNGLKVSIALEELGLPYENHIINIMKGEQFAPDFLKVSPNNKIPAIVDPNGPEGKSLPLFESGAILLYLAEKTGKLIPKDPIDRLHTIQWVFWQMAGLGPMFGQFGHFFHYAPEKIPYAIKRYTEEARRLLGVLEKQLEGHDYIVGNEFTIADIAVAPWVYGLDHHYKAREQLKLEEFPKVERWLRSVLKRPAVLKAYESFNVEFKTEAFGSPLQS